jgi:high-affinity iron transporter
MLATAIIVFREVLEAALIVGIVLAASRGAAGRGFWVAAGVAGGVVGAAVVAAFAAELADAVAGVGQELFNSAILLIAVVMLGWHNVWMSRHGRALGRQMAELGHAVRTGGRPLPVLAVVVGIAVLREGSETVLFLYGIAATATGQASAMLAGGGLGLASGVACGAALYLGLLNIPTRHLFSVTSWMVVLLAAGMASQAAAFLVAADLLPPLGAQLWDSSSLLAQDSIAGRVLHTLVGYDDRPAGIQLLFYGATLGVILVLMQTIGRVPSGGPPQRPATAPATAR